MTGRLLLKGVGPSVVDAEDADADDDTDADDDAQAKPSHHHTEYPF